MEITDVKIFPRRMDEDGENKLKAYAAITFDGAFVVNGLKIIDGKDGLFVAMPGVKKSDNVFQDIAHPLNTRVRKYIEGAVIDKFYQLLWTGRKRA